MQEMMINVVAGYVAAHAAEWVKKNPNLAFVNENTVRRVRFMVVILGLVAQLVLNACEPGGLGAMDMSAWFKLVLDTVVTFIMAEFTYHQTMKKPKLPE